MLINFYIATVITVVLITILLYYSDELKMLVLQMSLTVWFQANLGELL